MALEQGIWGIAATGERRRKIGRDSRRACTWSCSAATFPSATEMATRLCKSHGATSPCGTADTHTPATQLRHLAVVFWGPRYKARPMYRHSPPCGSTVRSCRSHTRSSTLLEAFSISLVHGIRHPDRGTHGRLCIPSCMEGLSGCDIEMPVCWFACRVHRLAVSNTVSSSGGVGGVGTRRLGDCCG